MCVTQRWIAAQLGADIEAGAGVPRRTSLFAASPTTEVHGSVWREHPTTSVRPSAVYRQLAELGVDGRALLDQTVHRGESLKPRCLNRVAHSLNRFIGDGMWRSSHSNSTTFQLRTFSADSKFVEFFHVPVVEFEPQVYTIGTTCLHPPATGTTNWTNARCLIVWKDQISIHGWPSR